MNDTSTSDSDWILRAFDDWYDSIYAYLARRVGVDIAPDLASEVFATAASRRHAFDPVKGSTAGWLYGIASNLISTQRRAERRRLRAYTRHGLTVDSDDPWTQVDDGLDRSSDQRELAAALARLRPAHRDVLLLSAWTELTYEEIAEALDIPVGTVRSRLSRAKAEMRELITRVGQEEATPSRKDVTWIA